MALLLLLLLGSAWGSGYVIAKYATMHGVPPLGYAFWQSIGPAILLGLLVKKWFGELKLEKKYWRFYLITGLVGIAIPNSVMYFCAAHIPAGLLAVIVNTAPILTYPIALGFKLEKFQWLRILAVMLGLTGIFFVILPHTSLPDSKTIPWALLLLISPLCFASCAVYASAKRPPNSNSLVLAFGMLLCSSILLTPLVLSTQHFYPLWLYPNKLTTWLIILEIILSSSAYIILFQLLKTAGPVYYSLVGGVVTMVGLFWGRVIFQEHLNLFAILAVCFILTAIILMTLSHYTKKGAI